MLTNWLGMDRANRTDRPANRRILVDCKVGLHPIVVVGIGVDPKDLSPQVPQYDKGIEPLETNCRRGSEDRPIRCRLDDCEGMSAILARSRPSAGPYTWILSPGRARTPAAGARRGCAERSREDFPGSSTGLSLVVRGRSWAAPRDPVTSSAKGLGTLPCASQSRFLA
jgi:hypothetical protein